MHRHCINNVDKFCYICGELTFASQKGPLTFMIKKAYHLYFGCKVGDQDKSWAPHICCNSCATNLRQWLNGKRKSMPFAVPMIWREPTDHTSNCYSCMVLPVSKGISKKKKWILEYPNIPSALRPVPHDEELPIPEPPDVLLFEPDDEEDDRASDISAHLNSEDPDFDDGFMSSKPHLISQHELNDLTRDLDLPKNKAELLGSRLQQWNLLNENVRVCKLGYREKDFLPFFTMENELVTCNDIDGLMSSLSITHNPDEWRLYIDSSKLSLKAVLLHVGNVLPSIPVTHSVHMKESHESMEIILSCISYHKYQWQLCGDLKVVAILLGLQLG